MSFDHPPLFCFPDNAREAIRVAARTIRRTRLRIAAGRPSATDLVTAFTRPTASPRPVT